MDDRHCCNSQCMWPPRKGYGTNGMPCNLPYQAILSDAGLPYRPTPCAPILISASSSTSSISYLPEMTCGTRCRLSSQNIPKLTSAHWASHQATGRKNHCGAHDDEDRDCRKKEKMGWFVPTSSARIGNNFCSEKKKRPSTSPTHPLCIT